VELREQPFDGKQLSRSVQRAPFSLRISPSLLREFPSDELTNLWGPIYSISRAPRKPPSPSYSISLLTLYMRAPDIYECSPTPVTAFLAIANNITNQKKVRNHEYMMDHLILQTKHTINRQTKRCDLLEISQDA
jgi:hypothetical protein